MEKTFEEVVAEIRARDSRYAAPAYDFVRGGLDFTVKRLGRASAGERRSRHVSGAELCEGLRDYALERYGVLAGALLARWGLRRTADFGAIVFLLAEAGVFGVSEDDRPEHFSGCFDFAEAFRRPFTPGIRLRRRVAEPSLPAA